MQDTKLGRICYWKGGCGLRNPYRLKKFKNGNALSEIDFFKEKNFSQKTYILATKIIFVTDRYATRILREIYKKKLMKWKFFCIPSLPRAIGKFRVNNLNIKRMIFPSKMKYWAENK